MASRSLTAATPVVDVQAGEFACVLADLGVGGHPDAGQVEARVLDQLPQREAAAVAGADERDADRHPVPPQWCDALQYAGWTQNWNRF